MYLKQKYQRYKKKSYSNFFEHDDRVNNNNNNKNNKNKNNKNNKNTRTNLKKLNVTFNRNKKFKNKTKQHFQKDKIVNCKQNLIMCYCHCSLSQLHANTPTICCNNAAIQQKNCSGFGGLPINWEFFQSRCQCGVCELNFLRNLNRLSSPNITEFLKHKNQNIEKFKEMSSTSPLAQIHKRKQTSSRSNSNSKDIPQLVHINVDKGKNSEDLNSIKIQSSTKEVFKEISEKKVQDMFTNKKHKKKKKKKHKKSKYKSSKSDRTEGEFIKKKKSRKHKRNKKDCNNSNEFDSVVRNSSLKSINEEYSKVSKIEVENFEGTPEIKSHEYEKIYNNSPSSEIDNRDLSPIFNNNLKTSEKLNVERKFSRSPSTETLSDYTEYNKKSKLKPSIVIADSVNKKEHFNKQEGHHFSHRNTNTPELSPQKKNTSDKNSELLVFEKVLDNSNSRNFKSSESRQSTDIIKSSNFPLNTSKEISNRSSKNLSYAKGTAPALDSLRSNKKNSNERQFDSYNENAISGKDLDSYVNAIMTDEYKEKKLNDFKLLEELKNNIAIKAKEKIKSIEKISNDNFSTIPSVNKFISGILSSPESINNNIPAIPNIQLKNLSKDNLEKKCTFIEKNLTITKVISEKSHSPSQSRSIDNEEYKNILKLKPKKISRSRSKSRYSTDSNESSPRSKYSYSSSRYSSRYSRSSSGSSHISTSNSRTRSRTYSRSPSIPRRRGSPSFLERRRITSARKRPIPYNRIPKSSNEQYKQIVCNSYTSIIRKYQPAT